jgi:hypothetical protein
MTTFQALADAFFKALTHLIPISKLLPDTITQGLMHWSLPNTELELLVLLMGSLAFLIFFRFDWLGMVSAALTSIVNPLSLKPNRRTLDQHTLIFLFIVFIPSFILNHALKALILENEILMHPFLLAGLSLVLGLVFQFSHRWNKRIFGLNHLKLGHAWVISLILLASVHPIFPMIGLLWIGFAVMNYHFEAIFKYSMLILGFDIFLETLTHLSQVGIKGAVEQVGALNSIAVLVISFTVFWIGLENLQKTLTEATFKTFQWISLAVTAYFVAYYFLHH